MFQTRNTLSGQFNPKINVCLSWNLVGLLIQMCWLWWWCSLFLRAKVFKNKKKLKGKGYLITESLTAMRMKKLTGARNSFGFTNLWTQDGKILCKEDSRIKGFFWLIVYREVTWRCSLKIAAPSCFYIQREKTHNFSGALNIVCGEVCFSSFLLICRPKNRVFAEKIFVI